MQKNTCAKANFRIIGLLSCLEAVVYILSPFLAECRLVSFFLNELPYFYQYESLHDFH